jgi:DNA-directed DNA polymerase III PolC
MLLNVHSYFSLRYGTLSIDQITDLMRAGGYPTAVLTDINNSTGILEFINVCKTKGLQGLAGMEFRNSDELLYFAIAKNTTGFRELNELMTLANKQHQSLSLIAPAFNQAFVIYPYGKKDVADLRDNEFIGIQPEHLNKILFEPRKNQERYVIWKPVTFKDDAGYQLHCQLRAIDHNILISQLEDSQTGKPMDTFVTQKELLEYYRAFPEIIRTTEKLLQQCGFNFDFKEVKNKKDFTSNRYDDKQLLEQYALEGLVTRYGKNDPIAKARVYKELEIIDNLNFSSYFLITDDICRYARSRNFHYVGRGSGANSIVAYCLAITDVCPIELDLYFERFLNPKRKTPPDFDMDFSWDERDDIYNYIFKRYQPGHTALLGAISTFRSRSILRELGKVYGLPKAEIDRLVHEPESMFNKNEVVNTILSVYNQMADFPNQRTIHASGVIVSEAPITSYCAMDYPPKGLPTMQIDMYTAEDIGFEKFDILSQRGLGHIKECVEIVRENKGEIVDIHQPRKFFKDPKIREQLRSANTVGCFYIESPAMRQLIAKLDCDNYLTLVAASSIIRPGVASSGMMKAYIERHRDSSMITYLHPVMEEQLQETYGVMVYQEDVMRIGHHFGGLDLADADVLRRMMSGKTRNKKHLEEIEAKFFSHCHTMGYPEHTSREVWRQMESFAGYSFNKAHSASYAVESYQSLYLKTYYPLEFMVSVLNNYGGFYSRKVYVNEIQRAGAEINLPCVNNSDYKASIKGNAIYLGYDCLLNLEQQYSTLIPKERLRNGPFSSLENFVLRTGIALEQLVTLIRSGALRFTGYGKKELLWEAHLMLSKSNKRKTDVGLFLEEGHTKPVLPKLETSVIEDIYDELELIGFPVSASFFDLVKTNFRGDLPASQLREYEGKTVRMIGDFVCDKTIRTKNGKGMKFGTFFDPNGIFFDTVHFPQTLKEYPFYGGGIYLILGKVVLDFGYPAIEVQKIAKLPVHTDPRSE